MSILSIDTLIAAAEFIEEKEKKRQASPQQQQQIQPIQQAVQLPLPPPQPLLAPQQAPAPLSHVQPAAVVLHQVLQPQPQPQAIPIQHVTIQHAPANGHGHILTAQPVNTIRIHHKKDVVTVPGVNRLTVMNSFDLINPAVIDQGSGEVKRKQPPMAFRTGTREVHNKLEKNRRAHLKDCFEELNLMLPNARETAGKKTSNLNILDSALKCIEVFKQEAVAKEALIEQLAKQKIGLQQRYTTLRKEIKSLHNIDVPDAMEVNPRLKRPRDGAPTTPTSPIVEKATEATPLTAGTTTTTAATATATATMVGNVLKLPKSITAGGKDEGGGAFTFAANGGLVLVPKAALGGGGEQHLTAQFVSAHHHHHHHRHPADAKVIVNAQYVVKPLVVVSTPSRPS